MICPRCGSDKFWLMDGEEVYCNNPQTKDVYLSRCFYHPSLSQQQKILRQIFGIDLSLRESRSEANKKYRAEHLEQEKIRVRVYAWSKKTNLPRRIIEPIVLRYKRLTKEIVWSEVKKNKQTPENKFCIL